MSHSGTVLSRLSSQVAPAQAERAAAWAGRPEVVEPRRSASVVLLRDGGSGLETYLLHRHARMRFAAGMVVFPGGGVEPADSVGDADERVVVRCAIRETFEETGVALASTDLLPWAHWITPEVEPRRYDTTFFVAAQPTGQEPADVSGETVSAGWATARATLAAAVRGELSLMPPTLSILLELDDCADVAAVLRTAEGRVVATVLPRLVHEPEGWRVRYPVVDRSAG